VAAELGYFDTLANQNSAGLTQKSKTRTSSYLNQRIGLSRVGAIQFCEEPEKKLVNPLIGREYFGRGVLNPGCAGTRQVRIPAIPVISDSVQCRQCFLGSAQNEAMPHLFCPKSDWEGPQKLDLDRGRDCDDGSSGRKREGPDGLTQLFERRRNQQHTPGKLRNHSNLTH